MVETFIYKRTSNCEIKGDFFSVHEEQAPLIVYIHGGGLIWGSRRDIVKEQVTLYNQAGFNVCSIDYRLAPEAKLPQIAEDIKDALIWLKEKGSKEYNFDPNRIAVTGSSAGGFLALLSGTFQVKPKVVVSFYGYGNILAEWYTKPSIHFMKMTTVPENLAKQLIQAKPVTEAPIERRYGIYLYCRQQGKWNEYVSGLNPQIAGDKLRIYCPVENIDAGYPSTLLLHGDADKDVPYSESVKMSEALTKFGVTNEFITVPNGEHSFDQDMQKPNITEIFRKVLAFLKKNL